MRHSAQSEIDGVLLVDKGPGMTSHDVVAVARRTLNTKKVGHCGTLDPMATGLLIVVVGKATKIQDLLMAEDKEYEGTLTLGITTSTQDKEGDDLEQKPVPEFSRQQIEEAFAVFRGDFYQLPPMVSAIKKDGVPLYKLARQGKEVEREPRSGACLSSSGDPGRTAGGRFRVSSAARAFMFGPMPMILATRLGCGAHLSALRRTRSGKFDLTRAGDLPAVESRSGRGYSQRPAHPA